jgi:hypothetical protein
VSNFFVAARRSERKKLFFYRHYYYSNPSNELENLVEFYIFTWGTAPGGNEDIWAIELYSGRMQIQKNKKSFSDSNDESRLFYLFSKTFGQMTIFLKKLAVQ